MGGEQFFQSAWLHCRLSASFKDDEAYVLVDDDLRPEPLAFYVANSLVRPVPPAEEVVAGVMRVTLLHRENGRSVVEVSGEPVTNGPRVDVPSALLEPLT